MATVVQNLVRLMEKNGISGNRLQIDCGLSNSAVTEWKKGKSNPSANNLSKIAEYFDVPISYFYEEEPPAASDEPRIVVPPILNDVMVAFHTDPGAPPLDQSDIDALAAIAEKMIKAKK